MTSKEKYKRCDRCEEKTLHYIETNTETGWRRERCEECEMA